MFYDNLLAVCEERGIYPTQALKSCGCATGSLGSWKKGAWPNSEIVVKLATHLNVSTDRLLLGVDAEEKDADAITGISDDALKVGCLWDNLDEPGRAIILGEIYKRLEARSNEADADADAGRRAGRVG